jgi:hypothetical protein
MAIARETGTVELDRALGAIVERTAELAGADVVVARLADERGALIAHAVHAASESVRAELESSRIEADAISVEEQPGVEHLPRPL